MSASVAGKSLPASIELSVKQAIEDKKLAGLFPPGTRVYIADVGNSNDKSFVAAAKRINELGYTPVPHFAARRCKSRSALALRVDALAAEANVRDVLIVGGGLSAPLGPFASSMDLLDTGFFDKRGVNKVALAGHPEGSPDFSEETALQVLKVKSAFGERSDAEMRIVTQFAFDPQRYIEWSDALAANGITLPIHIGLAGPANITTLIKFAALCGIGNSIEFLKKRSGALPTLLGKHSPEEVAGPIEHNALANEASLIQQLHVFPFGGLGTATDWLVQRGSWQKCSA